MDKAIKERAKQNIISITDKALNHLKHLIALSKGKYSAIRVSVKQGGCSGYSYSIEYAKTISQLDEVIELNGFKVLVDKKATMFLLGCEMDYINDTFESGFIFKNPKEKSRCGCGKSFGI